ncbi:MAG: S-methyl-5-thioribose kinase, partial [Bacilli bacterium]
IESEALRTHGAHAPGTVPAVYHYDGVMAAIVMEDLTDYRILRGAYCDGFFSARTAETIGSYIANTHYYTSDLALSPAEKRTSARDFFNPELCNITEDLVFTDPFFDAPTNNITAEVRPYAEALWADEAALRGARAMKWRFLNEQHTLVHGDLHTGSVFVKGDDTRVIDPEFAFYGPFGFDLGQYVANLVLHAVSLPNAERAPFWGAIETVVETFEATFRSVAQTSARAPFREDVFVEELLRSAWTNTVGFAGCEVVRRTIGLAGVADLERLDETAKVAAKAEALAIGRALLGAYTQIADVQTLLRVVQGEEVTV